MGKPGVLAGPSTIVRYIDEMYIKKDVVVTLYFGDTVLANLLMRLNETECDFEDATSKVKGKRGSAWDPFCRAIILLGELIEMVDDNSPTLVTLPITDFCNVKGVIQGDVFEVMGGSQWLLRLERTHEPVRYHVHEIFASA